MTKTDPATEDTSREELHFRRIDMRGWRRSDGRFEVEGRVTDRKPTEFAPWNGDRVFPPNVPMHDMGVRIVFDLEMTVHAVETFTDSSPYPVCPEGGRALQSLVGLRMTTGWHKAVRDRLSGARSCTHLMELLGPLATTAFQSLSFLGKARVEQVDATGRPFKIDSCYAYGAERELVMRFWPAFHRPPRSEG